MFRVLLPILLATQLPVKLFFLIKLQFPRSKINSPAPHLKLNITLMKCDL